MKRFVLDASVALAWFLDHPVPSLATRVQHSLFAGDRALVPALWHLEVANALVLGERRGVVTSDDVSRSLGYLDQLLLSAIESRGENVPVQTATRTAQAFRLTAYDAVYLDLAREEGVALATLDKELRSAATRHGVEIIR